MPMYSVPERLPTMYTQYLKNCPSRMAQHRMTLRDENSLVRHGRGHILGILRLGLSRSAPSDSLRIPRDRVFLGKLSTAALQTELQSTLSQ
jgi:hypothetical protein